MHGCEWDEKELKNLVFKILSYSLSNLETQLNRIYFSFKQEWRNLESKQPHQKRNTNLALQLDIHIWINSDAECMKINVFSSSRNPNQNREMFFSVYAKLFEYSQNIFDLWNLIKTFDIS